MNWIIYKITLFNVNDIDSNLDIFFLHILKYYKKNTTSASHYTTMLTLKTYFVW